MADHKHGEMSVTSQEKTFTGFVRWVAGVGIFSIAVLFFLALYNS